MACFAPVLLASAVLAAAAQPAVASTRAFAEFVFGRPDYIFVPTVGVEPSATLELTTSAGTFLAGTSFSGSGALNDDIAVIDATFGPGPFPADVLDEFDGAFSSASNSAGTGSGRLLANVQANDPGIYVASGTSVFTFPISLAAGQGIRIEFPVEAYLFAETAAGFATATASLDVSAFIQTSRGFSAASLTGACANGIEVQIGADEEALTNCMGDLVFGVTAGAEGPEDFTIFLAFQNVAIVGFGGSPDVPAPPIVALFGLGALALSARRRR